MVEVLCPPQFLRVEVLPHVWRSGNFRVMISLSGAARVPGQGLSPDASSSGSVCMFSALGLGREGARLGRAAGGAVVQDVAESWLSVIAAPVVDVVLLGSL